METRPDDETDHQFRGSAPTSHVTNTSLPSFVSVVSNLTDGIACSHTAIAVLAWSEIGFRASTSPPPPLSLIHI